MYKRRVFKSCAIKDYERVAEAIAEVLQSVADAQEVQQLLSAEPKRQQVCIELGISGEEHFAKDIWFKRVEQIIISDEALANPAMREHACWKLIDRWLASLGRANYVELSVSSYKGA